LTGFEQADTLRSSQFSLQCNEHWIEIGPMSSRVLRQLPSVCVHIIGNYGIKAGNPDGGRLAL